MPSSTKWLAQLAITWFFDFSLTNLNIYQHSERMTDYQPHVSLQQSQSKGTFALRSMTLSTQTRTLAYSHLQSLGTKWTHVVNSFYSIRYDVFFTLTFDYKVQRNDQQHPVKIWLEGVSQSKTIEIRILLCGKRCLCDGSVSWIKCQWCCCRRVCGFYLEIMFLSGFLSCYFSLW